MKNNKDVQAIENNYDNLEILEIVSYLVGVVINDIEYMNDCGEDFVNDLELGNYYTIRREDFKSLVSIVDTINRVMGDNK